MNVRLSRNGGSYHEEYPAPPRPSPEGVVGRPARAPRRPPQSLRAVYQRQGELLAKVRVAQANVGASKRQLDAKAAEARDKLPQLEEQARQALRGGREDLARFALQLRQVAVEGIANLEQQVGQLEHEGRTLSLVEHRLATEIEAFFARREVIEARYSTAEAHVHITEALSGAL